MTQELKPGEMEITADGGVRWAVIWSGDVLSLTAEGVRQYGEPNAEEFVRKSVTINGYRQIIRFDSGRTYSTEGSAIKEVAPAKSIGALLREKMAAAKTAVTEHTEKQRAPLAYFTERSRFDPFKGWEVYSDAVSSGFAGSAPAAELHALQRMTEGANPTHGSALLLKD